MPETQPSNTKPTVKQGQLIKLVMIPVLMFGFGFALIPLYDVFCEVTGLNGKTGRVEASVVSQKPVDASREIDVSFIAITGNGLPWKFEPLEKSMTVHPGRIYEAMYRVTNPTSRDTVGQAVPSVSPIKASLHFNKTECFCFSRQELKAGETRDMPLRFVINHDIPQDVVELTLSYTFFNIAETAG